MCKGRAARCSRRWVWPCRRPSDKSRRPPQGKALRLVPRRLIDALSPCRSWRCCFVLSKMSENLLVQVQGMIAEYERAKIMERSRRGKQHAARRGSVNVLSAAPYGYRYIRKSDGD